ncbi:DUF342 domain-containing protein [Paenalkalicoccus suaedae]|uniref:DUF342 domain-containing protein n=1 Tax=Paenalkalicoccus suaedae TaxID=2592382 RepID=A0A859FEP1_9BACI|nr:FapA family protein [Paenalkalicoccus suaedae]QKS71411.1 DUF342 domain-containing protein [Paenalkalicoccus suaedae]
MDLHEYFAIKVSADKLQGELIQRIHLDEPILMEDMKAFVKEFGLIHGVDDKLLQEIAEKGVSEPTVIASGTPAIHGTNASLWTILERDQDSKVENEGVRVDLRQVQDIPMVEADELVARKIPATKGTDGKAVDGTTIPSKPGKDLTLRPGKNTRIGQDELTLYSMTPGQVSKDMKTVHVYPVYEVNGDLDLKIGNIDFLGNVVIRGNVPAGFSIKARGDIRISGSVEAAHLDSEGSIYINQGVVAQGGGLINALGDIHTSFLNQANVESGKDVVVSQMILHSQVTAQGMIYCKQGKGSIVGGKSSASKGIEVNEVGNKMSTPTSLYVGVTEAALFKERSFLAQKNEAKETKEKLKPLLAMLLKKQQEGSLTAKERITLLRIKNAYKESDVKILSASEYLEELGDLHGDYHQATIKIFTRAFANTDLHFGKYRRKLASVYENVIFKIEANEITFEAM